MSTDTQKNKSTIWVVAAIIVYTAIWLIDCANHAGHNPNKWITGLSLSLIFGVFVSLAFGSDLLRDIVANPDAMKGKPPYSLSRTQLAVWITILSSFYIYAVLWDGHSPVDLNTTALTLMGISAATFVGGAVLDTSEIQQGIVRSQDTPSSGNFLKDILSDKDGISLQRFQNVVWTVVAIIIYFYKYNNPPMPNKPPQFLPDLSSTLLALTGISSATYLTLKARENVPATGKPGDLTIELIAGNSKDPDILALIKAGVTTADVRITTPSNTGVVSAKNIGPNQYEARNMPFADYSIDLSGSQAIPGKTASYKGKGTFTLNANTPMPIKIQLS